MLISLKVFLSIFWKQFRSCPFMVRYVIRLYWQAWQIESLQTFGKNNLKCIKNTKTKGIIEKQNHSSKNIFLDAKNDRIDVVIPKRFYASTCLQHQYIIESTRQTPLTPKKKEKVNKDKQRKLLYLTKELKREKKIRNWILLSQQEKSGLMK